MSTKSMSLGLAHEMIVTLNKEGFTSEMAKKIQQDSELAHKIVDLISDSDVTEKQILNLPELTTAQKSWVDLYKKYFNLDIDPSIIKEIKGKWEIFIPKSLTAQQVFDAFPFPKWKYTDTNLNTAIPTNDRIADKDYIVYVDQNVEADEQFQNMSANDLRKIDHKGITLLERLVLELKYFEKTGEHLDKNNYTLCSGSRYSVGGIPCVYWCDGKLKVRWFSVSDAYSYVCSREVTLP